MIKETIIVKKANGTVYRKTIEKFDTAEEYYGHVSKRSVDDIDVLRCKVKRIDRELDELFKNREEYEMIDTYDDIRCGFRKKYGHYYDEF